MRSRKQRVGLVLADFLAKAQEVVRRKMVGELVYRSTDGKIRLISEIDDKHLKNIIRMFMRDDVPESELFDELKAEVKLRFERKPPSSAIKKAYSTLSRNNKFTMPTPFNTFPEKYKG